MSLFSRAEISDATWFVMHCHLSRSDHFEDYRNIHKIQQTIMLMNVGNPEALGPRDPKPQPFVMFSTHLTAPRHSLLRGKTASPKGGQNQHRSSWEFWCRMLRRDLLPCRDLFLQLQFVINLFFPLFWTNQQGMFPPKLSAGATNRSP